MQPWGALVSGTAAMLGTMTDPDDAQHPPTRYPRARLSPAKDERMVVTVPRAP
jgi:hypothetical protein